MIVTGTCLRSAQQAKELCEASTSYPLYYTAGVSAWERVGVPDAFLAREGVLELSLNRELKTQKHTNDT